MIMDSGVEVRMVETGMKDRQVALIAAAIIWNSKVSINTERVFETAEELLKWLRKEP